MKSKIFSLGLFLLLFYMIRYPSEALLASQKGMQLWLNTLLPTLLPFFILTSQLINHTDFTFGSSVVPNIIYKLFRLSPYGFCAFFFGILCGFPVGAKTASDLYSSGKISQKEASYLLTFSGQPSPMFISSFLWNTCFRQKVPLQYIFFILYFSNTICMLFFRFIYFHKKEKNHNNSNRYRKKETSSSSCKALSDVSIMNAFETIARIGGYILLFSIIGACISHYCTFSKTTTCLILGSIEITSGTYQLSLSKLPFLRQFIYSMMLVSAGGLCITAQIKSVLHADLSILPYCASRVLSCAITGILSIYIQFI